MVLVPGEPCVGTKKRKRNQGAEDEPLQLCAAVETHKWYQGPLCKNCYLRKKTAESSGKPAKMGKIEDAPAESGGDIPLDVCLKVSAARCVLPPSARPQLACIRAPCPCVLWACTDYWPSCGRWSTGATLRRSRTTTRARNASSATVYGWFKFESDADGVRRLDRQWVLLHDLEQ